MTEETDKEPPATARLDLFGDPVPEGWGKRGRPEHIATLESRNKVVLLLALGWGNERIAGALYITLPTLRKHYKGELKLRDVARDRMNAAMARKLWALFQNGSVAAAKEFLGFVEQNDLMQYGQNSPPPKSTKEQKLGKKEQALVDAQQPDAGTPLGELMAERQAQPVN